MRFAPETGGTRNPEDLMRIEILGSGCPRCFELERRARQAVKLAGLEADVSHVTDLRAMAARGVLATPALAIDGQVRLTGNVPPVAELVTLLINHLAAAEPRPGTD
jgi:small redox-active disulfide protein 2